MPSRIPALPEDPVERAVLCVYRKLREIPAQHNLLDHPLHLSTRAGLVLHFMRDPTIMAILKDQLKGDAHE